MTQTEPQTAVLTSIEADLRDWQPAQGVAPLRASIERLKTVADGAPAEVLADAVIASLSLATNSIADADLVWPLASHVASGRQSDVVAHVVSELTYFRHATGAWREHLEPPSPAFPAALRRSVAKYLEATALIERYVAFLRAKAAGDAFARALAEGLAVAAVDARARIGEQPIRSRMWSMGLRGSALGLADLAPPLLPSDGGRLPAAMGTGTADSAASMSEIALAVCDAAVEGELGVQDMEALRRGAQNDPATWALAHRAAFRADGFSVPIVLQHSHGGSWTVPDVLWTPAPASRLPTGEASRQLISTSAEGVARRHLSSEETSANAVERSELPAFPLAERALPLVAGKLEIYGDAEGLWCRYRRGASEKLARCDVDARQQRGNRVAVPLLCMEAPTEQLEVVRRFRPGPLRTALDPSGSGLDRAYAPLGFVASIGESILRGLLGWDFRECARRLHSFALESSHVWRTTTDRDGAELVDAIAGARESVPPWLSLLPLDPNAATSIGAGGTLGELLQAWDRGDAIVLPPKVSGAEIDTLRELPGVYRPRPGDVFVLLATRTSTSVLAARIVGCWLRARFRPCEVRIALSDTLAQRPRLSGPDGAVETRFDLCEDASERFYRDELARVDELLATGTDVVLLLSGGTKWQAGGALRVAVERALPFLYHAEERTPMVRFACDLGGLAADTTELASPQSPPTGVDRRKSLVLSVGISLRGNYARARRLPRDAPDPTVDELVAWCRAHGEGRWRDAAELTGVEAWLSATRARPEQTVVTLVASQDGIGAACADAVAILLRDAGFEVADAIRIPDLSELCRRPEWWKQLGGVLLEPIARRLDMLCATGQPPTVIAGGGYKLTSALLQMLGARTGCDVYLAPESSPGEGIQPLLQVHSGRGQSDPRWDVRVLPVEDVESESRED